MTTMNENELKETAAAVMGELTAHLGLQCTCGTADCGEDGAFKLTLSSPEAGEIIGRKGQHLIALELIFNRIIKARTKSDDTPWIPVEVDGYSTGRTGEHPHRGGTGAEDGRHGDSAMVERFTAIAQAAAKEVRYWKEERRIGPYLPAERRVIHNVLKDDPEVTTESEPAPEAGERMKCVVVRPAANAPEK